MVKHTLYTISLFIHGLSEMKPRMILPSVFATPKKDRR